MGRILWLDISINQGGDIRDVISVWKLIKKSDGPQDVDGIIDTLVKYGKETRGRNEDIEQIKGG